MLKHQTHYLEHAELRAGCFRQQDNPGPQPAQIPLQDTCTLSLSLQNIGIMAGPSKTPAITARNSHLKLAVYHGIVCQCDICVDICIVCCCLNSFDEHLLHAQQSLTFLPSFALASPEHIGLGIKLSSFFYPGISLHFHAIRLSYRTLRLDSFGKRWNILRHVHMLQQTLQLRLLAGRKRPQTASGSLHRLNVMSHGSGVNMPCFFMFLHGSSCF